MTSLIQQKIINHAHTSLKMEFIKGYKSTSGFFIISLILKPYIFAAVGNLLCSKQLFFMKLIKLYIF